MIGPPADILRELRARFGKVEVCEPVGGGCVNPAVRVRLSFGDAFLKFNPSAARGQFSVEAAALEALRQAASGLYVPEVIAVGGGDGSATGYLLIEWLASATPPPGFGSALGSGLAELHRSTGQWGWPSDGFIGPLPMENASTASWSSFWRDRRIRPQLARATAAGWRIGRQAEWDRLWDRLDELLSAAEVEGPSLVHGDLWNGNVIAARVGEAVVPALVDPAAYFGHREVDLAMAELFGGFPSEFFVTYEKRWPLHPESRAARRAVYQLYYLLVHVNVFGGAYVRRTEAALRAAIGSC